MVGPDPEVQESRCCERFLIDPPLEGAFGGSAVDILDLAEKGLRAQHPSPVRPGTTGSISMRLPGNSEPLRLRAHVVWCRLSTAASPDGKLLYLSGLRFDDESDVLQQSIELLLEGDKARRDRDSLKKKSSKRPKSSKASGSSPTMKVIRQHRKIDEDTLLLVKQAWSYMKQNPVEATKWYNRAKYALKEGNAPLLHHKDDVLAIWEYLERIVAIDKIEWVLDNEHLM